MNPKALLQTTKNLTHSSWIETALTRMHFLIFHLPSDMAELCGLIFKNRLLEKKDGFSEVLMQSWLIVRPRNGNRGKEERTKKTDLGPRRDCRSTPPNINGCYTAAVALASFDLLAGLPPTTFWYIRSLWEEGKKLRLDRDERRIAFVMQCVALATFFQLIPHTYLSYFGSSCLLTKCTYF